MYNRALHTYINVCINQVPINIFYGSTALRTDYSRSKRSRKSRIFQLLG